jgi:hypothetical protein
MSHIARRTPRASRPSRGASLNAPGSVGTSRWSTIPAIIEMILADIRQNAGRKALKGCAWFTVG